MKLSIFSTYDRYGAGAAAYRLHEAFEEKGVASNFFVGTKNKGLSVELGFPAARYHLVQDIWQKTAYGNTFSALQFGMSVKTLEDSVREADIINIHWVSNFLSLDNMIWLLHQGKRVVITMHDENLYTGGCHYRHGCDQYLRGCESCGQMPGMPGLPAEILASKLNRFPREAVIVTPSRWLASLAASSPVLGHNRIEVIPNGINPNLYHPLRRDDARKRLGYDDSHFVVLFGCHLLKDERKGLKYILEAIEHLKSDADFSKFDFVCFGGDAEDMPPEVRSLGYIDDENELISLYAMADVTVVPSLEDNLPNIVLESLMCGTPVIGFPSGGIPEAIIDGKNGLLVPPKDSALLANAIKQMAQIGRAMRTFCREDAVARYSARLMADRYMELFRSIGHIASKPSASFDYDIWFQAMKAEVEEYQTLSDLMESEKERARLHASACKMIIHESITRPVAIYGYGAWGRHIFDVVGDAVTYIIDKAEVDSIKYRDPSRLEELREDNAFVFIAALSDTEMIANVVKAGFRHGENYICIKDL